MRPDVSTVELSLIKETAFNLLAKTAVNYPKTFLDKLWARFQTESNPAAKSVLASIVSNIISAVKAPASLCQDTGIPVFHLYLSPGMALDGDVHDALAEATRKATAEIPLRKNVVEPFTLQNSGTNTGWGAPFVYFHYDPRPGPLKMRVELKGFGGELKSNHDWIFTSTDNMENAVLAYALNNVILSKGEGCVPGFLGIGVGGYASEAALNAKNAIFRHLSTRERLLPAGDNFDFLTGLENRILRCVNRLGLGPMGGGGDTTTLDVYLTRKGTHTAAASVAVCQQCWASRGSEALIQGNRVSYLTPHFSASDAPALSEALKMEMAKVEKVGNVHALKVPLEDRDILNLKVGDVVFLSGTLSTARDRAHGRMASLVKNSRSDQIPPATRNSGVIYHCGPVMVQQNGCWCVNAAGPTTSSRFTDDAAYLVEQGIIKVSIGKGTMGKNMVQALKGRGVYLRAVGGCAVSYGQMIGETSVDWLDLGHPEAVWNFDVNQFGPLVVGIDSHGNSLMDDVMVKVLDRAEEIYRELGMNPDRRYVQYPQTLAGHSLSEVRRIILG